MKNQVGFIGMTIVAIGLLIALFISASATSAVRTEFVACAAGYDVLRNELSEAEALIHTMDDRIVAMRKEAESSAAVYVDEANVRGDFPNTEELGKAYPRIIIDGVKCDYDPDQKWFVHADYRCRVMWLGIGNDKVLMSENDWRDHSGPPFENRDGDIRLLMQPLQILDKGKWREVRPTDKLHVNAAVGLGLQKKDETPQRDTLSRLGRTNLWFQYTDSWRLVDTHSLDDVAKAGLPGGILSYHKLQADRAATDRDPLDLIMPFASVDQEGKWTFHGTQDR